MSLPFATKNTQYYLQAGCGLACAVASAEMALFVGALSLRFDLSEACSLRFDHVEACPLQIHLSKALSSQFDHAEALSLLLEACPLHFDLADCNSSLQMRSHCSFRKSGGREWRVQKVAWEEQQEELVGGNARTH
jgi:hypothetical protein